MAIMARYFVIWAIQILIPVILAKQLEGATLETDQPLVFYCDKYPVKEFKDWSDCTDSSGQVDPASRLGAGEKCTCHILRHGLVWRFLAEPVRMFMSHVEARNNIQVAPNKYIVSFSKLAMMDQREINKLFDDVIKAYKESYGGIKRAREVIKNRCNDFLRNDQPYVANLEGIAKITGIENYISLVSSMDPNLGLFMDANFTCEAFLEYLMS